MQQVNTPASYSMAKGHSRRLVNTVKFVHNGDLSGVSMRKQMTVLGTIVTIGFEPNDFQCNIFTLKQFVKIPRICNKTTR